MEYRVLIIDKDQTVHQEISSVLYSTDSEKNAVNRPSWVFPEFQIDTSFEMNHAFEQIILAHELDAHYAVIFIEMDFFIDEEGTNVADLIWEVAPYTEIVLLSNDSADINPDIQITMDRNHRLLFVKKPFEELNLRQLTLSLSRKWSMAVEMNSYISRLESCIASREAERDQALALVKDKNKELILARDAANNSARSKTEYVAVMSHEIRTPLTGVLGLIEILKETALDHDQTELVNILQDNGESLLDLINKILDFSKIEAGKMQLESGNFSVLDIIQKVQNLLKLRASKKGLLLMLQIDDDVPNNVYGDGGRLRQVLVNLIGNAIKHTDEGYVKTTISMVNQTSESIILQFSIEDSGSGIAEEDLDQLFEHFSQISPDATGTGLGLVVSKKIVELMGGRIWVESELDMGSTFSFSVVLQKVTQEEPVKKKSKPVRRKQGHGRILLVEDNPTNQKIAGLHLTQSGYQVDVADNGQIALDLLEQQKYDLVLMDLQMPVMDGYTAVKIMRRERNIQIPVIALSANVFGEYRTRCFEAGMNDFIAKPIRKTQFLKLIEQWIHESEQNQPKTEALHHSTPETEEPAIQKETQPLDYERLLEEFGGDQPLIKNVIKEFILNAEKQIQMIVEAYVKNEIEVIKDQAHSLRGGSANLCAFPFSQMAATLEDLCISKDEASISQALMNLNREFGSLVEYLRFKNLYTT